MSSGLTLSLPLGYSFKSDVCSNSARTLKSYRIGHVLQPASRWQPVDLDSTSTNMGVGQGHASGISHQKDNPHNCFSPCISGGLVEESGASGLGLRQGDRGPEGQVGGLRLTMDARVSALLDPYLECLTKPNALPFLHDGWFLQRERI